MIDRMSAQSLMKSCSWTLRPAQFSTCIDIAEAIRAHRDGGRSVFDAWTVMPGGGQKSALSPAKKQESHTAAYTVAPC